MQGQDHIGTQPDDAKAAPLGTLALVGIAVLAVIAGVAGIAAWLAPSVEDDGNLSTIVVQPSVSMPVPAGTSETPTAGGSPSNASPTAPVSPSSPASSTASPRLLAGSAVPATAPKVGPSPAPGTSGAAPSLLTTPAPATSLSRYLTAGYALTDTWDGGFAASVTVRNATGSAHSWTVVLTYSTGTKITVTDHWNAVPTVTGRRVTSSGGSLAAGASYSFGFDAETSGDGSLTSCTINGKTCDS